MSGTLLIAVLLAAASAKLDTANIEQLTGLKGKLDEKEGVFKVSYPRSDLQVTAAGVKMTPALGLTAWAAFTDVSSRDPAVGFAKVSGQVAVMGDIVLTEDQVNPTMSAALDNGLEVTALHNHFFWEQPRVMFMHIGGMGDETKLATAVGKVFAKLKEKGEVPNAAIDPAKTTLDPAKIDAALGQKGELKDGVYKVTIGRDTKMHGHSMGNAMGVNTWAAFAGSDDQAMVDGDFAMLESELQPVLKALRGAGINIVAIHQHMTNETPRIMFLHYWGFGSTAQLAGGLKTALAQTKASK
jgi:hypothetical protein